MVMHSKHCVRLRWMTHNSTSFNYLAPSHHELYRMTCPLAFQSRRLLSPPSRPDTQYFNFVKMIRRNNMTTKDLSHAHVQRMQKDFLFPPCPRWGGPLPLNKRFRISQGSRKTLVASSIRCNTPTIRQDVRGTKTGGCSGKEWRYKVG